MNNNSETLKTYEAGVAKYNAAAIPVVQGSLKEWIDSSLELLPQSAHILEIGSAHGRDANYIESKGFTVERTDAAKAFVSYMKSQGNDAKQLDALKDDFAGPFDMIYANAVLLHFSPKEVGAVLKKSKVALCPKGILSFSVKIGEGDGWSTSKLDGKRYFYYWQEEPLRRMVEKSGFKILSCLRGKSGHDNGDWLHVIAESL